MRALVLDKETEDSRDPQPVKLISHRSRIGLQATPPGPNKTKTVLGVCEKGRAMELASVTEQNN